MESGKKKYQVALSFAGEQRTYVEQVAAELKTRGVRLFYDHYELADLWGNHMSEKLHEVYENNSEAIVLFISAEYVRKAWPTHERRASLSAAVSKDEVILLPVRFDATPVPGLLDDILFVHADDVSPGRLANLICEKLKIETQDLSILGAPRLTHLAAGLFRPLGEHSILMTLALSTEGELTVDGISSACGFSGEETRLHLTNLLNDKLVMELIGIGLLFGKYEPRYALDHPGNNYLAEHGVYPRV